MQYFLSEVDLVNIGCEAFYCCLVFHYLTVPRSVKPSVSNEMLYFLKLSSIQPHAVFAASVDYDPGDPAEIPPVHQLAAANTWYIFNGAPYGRLSVLAPDIDLMIDMVLSRGPVKFISVKPDSSAFRTEVIFFSITDKEI